MSTALTVKSVDSPRYFELVSKIDPNLEHVKELFTEQDLPAEKRQLLVSNLIIIFEGEGGYCGTDNNWNRVNTKWKDEVSDDRSKQIKYNIFKLLIDNLTKKDLEKIHNIDNGEAFKYPLSNYWGNMIFHLMRNCTLQEKECEKLINSPVHKQLISKEYDDLLQYSITTDLRAKISEKYGKYFKSNVRRAIRK